MPIASGLTTNSWWSVPKCCATSRACSSSSNAGSSKPIEKVFTRAPELSDIRPTTTLETIAPGGKGARGAGEEGAERYVADEMRPHGVGQHGAQIVDGVGFSARERLVRWHLPVLFD